MVEGAKRQKTPNEIALNILLAALTIVFLLATVTLLPFSLYSVQAAGHGTPVTMTVLIALLVCLDSDDDRRALVRHRHRRDGSHGASQRHCHVGQSRRGGG